MSLSYLRFYLIDCFKPIEFVMGASNLFLLELLFFSFVWILFFLILFYARQVRTNQEEDDSSATGHDLQQIASNLAGTEGVIVNNDASSGPASEVGTFRRRVLEV